ncbi:Fibrinogen- domains (FReDs) [Branchiostoma belcheri]|nr:Fibrinogen- domains (FReDs) [Branchiostoma belcheri]
MSSKKLVPNGEAAPEGSVGRHGNRWTNGIVLALSGLAAVVSFVTLLSTRDQQMVFMREIRDIQDQQAAFMKRQTDLGGELQGLKDQVLQMQLKQENEAKDTRGLWVWPKCCPPIGLLVPARLAWMGN